MKCISKQSLKISKACIRSHPPPLPPAFAPVRSCLPDCERWSSGLPQSRLWESCRYPPSSYSLCRSRKHCTQNKMKKTRLAHLNICFCTCIVIERPCNDIRYPEGGAVALIYKLLLDGFSYLKHFEVADKGPLVCLCVTLVMGCSGKCW